jgi:hypothetical protein
MTNNTNTQTITDGDFPNQHEGFPCAHPLPSLEYLADLNRLFQDAKKGLLDGLGKVDDEVIAALAITANELRTELAQAMEIRRRANA